MHRARERFAGAVLLWWLGAAPAAACGTCATAVLDLVMPPAMLWAVLPITWFLSLAVVSSLTRYHLRGQPSLTWSLAITLVAFVLGASALGPLAVFPLAVGPLYATHCAFRPQVAMPSSVRNAVRLTGLAHIVMACIGIGILVHTLSTRTDAEYVCRWSGTGPGRARFQGLRKEEPASIEAYRYIAQHGSGTIVGEAVERIGEIGDAATDGPMLEHLMLRANDDPHVKEAIDAALVALGTRHIGGVPHAAPQDEIVCERSGTFPVEDWSIAGVRVGRDTLEDVRRTLGAAPTIRPSRAEYGRQVLCYRFQPDLVAVFESSPLGSPQGQVTAISLLHASQVPFKEQCAVATDREADRLGSASRPGVARNEFEDSVGLEYCYRDETTTEWNFESQDGEWGVVSGLQARFHDGRLEWWHTYLVRSQ